MTAKKNLIKDLQQQIRDRDNVILRLKTKIALQKRHTSNLEINHNIEMENVLTNVVMVRRLYHKDLMWLKLGNDNEQLRSLMKHLESIEMAVTLHKRKIPLLANFEYD